MITVVACDGTIDGASWTLVGAATFHAALATVDQPASESSYAQAAGVAAGILKLSIPVGRTDHVRVNYYRTNPILVSGLNAANFPLLQISLFVNGATKASQRFEVDSAGDFFLASVAFGPLGILGSEWRADPAPAGRQLWLSSVAAPVRYGDLPIPEYG